MNDYFLRSMIRQRHEQILNEVKASRLSQLDRPRMDCGLKKKIRMFRSFLRQSKRSMVYSRPTLDERKKQWILEQKLKIKSQRYNHLMPKWIWKFPVDFHMKRTERALWLFHQ